MRIRWSGNVTHHGRQVELDDALILGVLQSVSPEAGFLGVDFHQLDQCIIAAGEFQVFDGLLVDVKHRGSGAELRRHVGNGCAVAQRQVGGAFTVEFEIGGDHLLRPQELGQRQHDVGRSDTRLRLAAQLNADDVRQAHP